MKRLLLLIAAAGMALVAVTLNFGRAPPTYGQDQDQAWSDHGKGWIVSSTVASQNKDSGSAVTTPNAQVTRGGSRAVTCLTAIENKNTGHAGRSIAVWAPETSVGWQARASPGTADTSIRRSGKIAPLALEPPIAFIAGWNARASPTMQA